MKMRLAAGLLLCGLSAGWIHAQGEAALVREVVNVKMEVDRNNAELRQYTWTEHTEVLVKGDVKQNRAALCRYDAAGKLVKTPVDTGDPKKKDKGAVSNRVVVRKKADIQDYIERAITMIQNYVPPSPEQLQFLLTSGGASMGKSEGGKSEIRFTNYFQRGDSMVFTYDTESKLLLKAAITSTMGTPKDPVTLEALWEKLPDGVNHVASTDLKAPAKKVEVKTRNVLYQKAP